MMAAAAAANMNQVKQPQQQQQQEVKVLPDKDLIKLLKSLGTRNPKKLFANLLHANVQLIVTKCLEMGFDAKEYCCLHTRYQACGEYAACLCFLLGKFNTRNYVVATTAKDEHLYSHVRNLRLIVVDNEGAAVVRAPVAVDMERDEVKAERRKMINKIKRRHSAA